MRSNPSPGQRPGQAKHRTFVATLASCLLLLLFLNPPPAEGCMFSQPPPPVCGKALHVASAVPQVELLPSGGTVNVSALVYLDLVDFPAGFGVCPAGPYSADVEVTLTCSPGPNGSGLVVAAPISLGFTQLSVPVSVPAGPARLCDVDIKATVRLADGMVLTAESDSLLCLGESAPKNPEFPRLDLQLLGEAGREVASTHPGDQASWTYRVTNNDPEESFDGRLVAESLNVSRLPGMTGPMPPGTGVFSISDPVQGDNFPLAFADDLFEGCVLLPEDPANPAVPSIQQQISLAPGESTDIQIYSRSWGMCADGSCSRGTVRVDGDFSDKSPGLACAGFISAADTSVPPSYNWPDAGEVAEASSPVAGTVDLFGEPRPGQSRLVTLIWVLIGLLINDLPSPDSPIIFSDTVMPELGRTQVQFVPKEPYRDDSSIDIEFDIQLDTENPFQLGLDSVELFEGIPTGFSDVAPSGRSLVALQDEFGALDSFFDVTYQFGGVGIDELGNRRTITWQTAQMRLLTNNSIRVQLGGGQAEPGAGNELLAIELAMDLRGFISEEPQGQLGTIFTDGFESGNVSRWSTSAP